MQLTMNYITNTSIWGQIYWVSQEIVLFYTSLVWEILCKYRVNMHVLSLQACILSPFCIQMKTVRPIWNTQVTPYDILTTLNTNQIRVVVTP